MQAAKTLLLSLSLFDVAPTGLAIPSNDWKCPEGFDRRAEMAVGAPSVRKRAN